MLPVFTRRALHALSLVTPGDLTYVGAQSANGEHLFGTADDDYIRTGISSIEVARDGTTTIWANGRAIRRTYATIVRQAQEAAAETACFAKFDA